MKKIEISVYQESENVFKVPFDFLKYRFIDFIQIAFWTRQQAEYDFAVPCNH